MRRKLAFTLVELLIVINVIAIVAAVAIPKFADSAARAKDSRLKQYLKMLREATQRFYADTGLYPKSADIVNGVTPTQGYDTTGTLVAIPTGTYNGPYLEMNGMRVEIAGISLAYGTTPPLMGNWRITGMVTSTDGTLYSSW